MVIGFLDLVEGFIWSDEEDLLCMSTGEVIIC